MPDIINKYRKPLMVLTLSLIFLLGLLFIYYHSRTEYIMGATLHTIMIDDEDITQPVYGAVANADLTDRFQRPSGQPALNTKYSFQELEDSLGSMPVFQNPEDLIKAYYGALKDASNMIGYHGGCGTVGSDKLPYPFAYKLLAPETAKEMSLQQFIESFKGTGHTTLLKIYPAYAPPDTPDFIQYCMTEIEVITGSKVTSENKNLPQPSLFAYYYGLVTVEHTASDGWKIKRIDYVPEDFLCAPYHSWFWEGTAVAEIIYKNWYKLIDRIDRIETRGNMHHIFASGNGKSYRFDFVQLTNGEQILLHENVNPAGQWQETNILKDDDQVFKFSILNPRLN